MKTFVIGDIHGCCRAFDGLLEKLQPDPSSDRLILLGDLFDRGPDSWEIFQRVKILADLYGSRFVLIRGNHEDYLLQQHLTLGQKMMWSRVGKQTTVRSFKTHGVKMEDSAGWIREHSSMVFKGEGFQCVHAGVKIEPPELNDSYTLMHDHDIVLQNGYRGTLVITGHIALDDAVWFTGDGETTEVLEEGKTYELPERGVICIDTGCGKGGRLTGMVIEGNEFVLVSVME